MYVLRCWAAGLLTVVIWAFALAGCGGQQAVKPKGIAFAPTIVGCSTPAKCTAGLRRRAARRAALMRKARNRRCPADKPDVLIRADGAPVCVVSLPPMGAAGISLRIPSAVEAQGKDAVADFKAGAAVATTTGCLACHRIADEGNNGPGSDLTDIGSHLPPAAIERALFKSAAPMPSFSRLPESQRRALVYFLAQLR